MMEQLQGITADKKFKFNCETLQNKSKLMYKVQFGDFSQH